MNPEDASKIVDQLATKDDRWLFLAMLVVVLIGGVMIIRYLVKRNEEQSKDHNGLVREMVIVLHECKDVMAKVLAKLDTKLVFVFASLSLFGCVTDEQGNSRFDAATFNAVTRTALDTYDRINGRSYEQPVNPPGAPFPLYPP
jgi:cytochrome c biogenesis factor